jgi:hypothetical protein
MKPEILTLACFPVVKALGLMAKPRRMKIERGYPLVIGGVDYVTAIQSPGRENAWRKSFASLSI